MTDTMDAPPSTSCGKKCLDHAATSPGRPAATENGNADAQTSKQRLLIPASRRQQLMRFFEDNPHEDLSVKAAAQKLGISEKVAAHYLSALRGERKLKRESVYSLNTQESST